MEQKKGTPVKLRHATQSRDVKVEGGVGQNKNREKIEGKREKFVQRRTVNDQMVDDDLVRDRFVGDSIGLQIMVCARGGTLTGTATYSITALLPAHHASSPHYLPAICQDHVQPNRILSFLTRLWVAQVELPYGKDTALRRPWPCFSVVRQPLQPHHSDVIPGLAASMQFMSTKWAQPIALAILFLTISHHCQLLLPSWASVPSTSYPSTYPTPVSLPDTHSSGRSVPSRVSLPLGRPYIQLNGCFVSGRGLPLATITDGTTYTTTTNTNVTPRHTFIFPLLSPVPPSSPPAPNGNQLAHLHKNLDILPVPHLLTSKIGLITYVFRFKQDG
ncbi:hypothetical protein BDN72DRAFT_855527 [Pluteus cervinus]|uniref:Uncharacterized protein n=1 Tax=Pluteus cervinus TaxID=181527 RepID=A0ACD3B383_9AGAR|nr:hypothetical protein BDN72DRAFT_855527 [Pluteus cervinus]